MSRLMRKAAFCIIGVLVSVWSGSAEEISLERALSVVQAASPEQLEVKVAESRVHLLEALSKRRIDLRPQLGILTLTSPVAMAASIGSGLLVNRNAAPSAYTVLGARVDLLTAELQDARTGFNKRLQTARTFFDLVDAQRGEKYACDERDAHDRDRSLVDRLVARGRLTMVDQLRYEQEHMQLVSDCLDALVRRKLASASLAMVLGMPRVELSARITDVSSRLVERAGIDKGDSDLFSGGEDQAAALRTKAAQIRHAATTVGRGGLPDISVFQTHATETGSLGNLSPNYLAGANYVYPTISWRIPLRNTGEHQAEIALLNSKLQKLAAELDLFEQLIRGELHALHALNTNAPERIAIEEQKLSIAERAAKMVSIRYEKGLALVTDLLNAQQQERRLRVSASRLREEVAGRKLLVLAASGRINQASIALAARMPEPQRGPQPQPPLVQTSVQTPAEKVLTSDLQHPVQPETSAPEVKAKGQQERPAEKHRATHPANTGGSARGGSDPSRSGSFVCGIVNGRVGNCVASSDGAGRRRL